MTVQECMSKMNLWEYRLWIHRLIEERKKEVADGYEPSLTDLYLIKLTMEMRLIRYASMGHEGAIEVNPEDFIIDPNKKPTKEPTKPVSSQLNNQLRNSQADATWQNRITGAQKPDIKQWLKSTT